MVGIAATVASGGGNIVEREELFTTPGTYVWTCPAGVTNVDIVCIGGGGGGMYWAGSSSTATYAMSGGGGGALAWMNACPVTAGTAYTVVVGQGGSRGAYSTGSTGGGQSYFWSTSIIRAGGGNPGRYNTDVAQSTYYVNSGYGTSRGGGNGGGTDSRSSSLYGPAGGGGAGGYSGNGGSGRDDYFLYGAVGAGGGAGGGGASNNTNTVDHLSGAGGGVGIYGQGISGTAWPDGSGGGGSGGTDGVAAPTTSGSSDVRGGDYGGGGGGSATLYWGYGGNGEHGAVRLIYRVTGRDTDLQFPSTNTGIRRKQTVI